MVPRLVNASAVDHDLGNLDLHLGNKPRYKPIYPADDRSPPVYTSDETLLVLAFVGPGGITMNAKVQAQALTASELSARSTARILALATTALFVVIAVLNALSY